MSRSSSSPPTSWARTGPSRWGSGPTGLTGLFHANGEMLGARAAQNFGVPFCLSTLSIGSIEDVRSVVQKPFWFQVYLMRDRGFNVELLDRAKAANCSAIMLTVDMPVQGTAAPRRQEWPLDSAASHAEEMPSRSR